MTFGTARVRRAWWLLLLAVLLAADIGARLVVLPADIPVGVVAAILGGPVFVLIVRRPRIEAL